MEFFKGKKDVLAEIEDEQKKYDVISSEFSKLLDVKNLSFLFGAGCSSLMVEDTEAGIPVMQPLAVEFYGKLENDDKTFLALIFIDIENKQYSKNLEAFFEAVLNYRNYLLQIEDITVAKLADNKIKIEIIVKKLKDFVLLKCTTPFTMADNKVLDLYKIFYRKLIFRDRNLPKPNVFTTNYDVFSEKAMDALSIHFSNGFSGVLDRFFNPSVFEYAFSENMDVAENKWQIIDHFVYLYKLHGSINWVNEQAEGQLYGIKEVQETSYDILKEKDNIMIYPSPAKQNTSLSSPYTDLFREFKHKISMSNTVLVVVGYGFGDEHVNNIIYQALSKPTFRLVIFSNPNTVQNLIKLNDPRIWIIGGKDLNNTSIHYFETYVNKIMPDLSEREIEDSVAKAIKLLVKHNAS